MLVTGGLARFGRRFVQRVLAEHNPKKVIILSRDELKQYEMQAELRQAFPPRPWPRCASSSATCRDAQRPNPGFPAGSTW